MLAFAKDITQNKPTHPEESKYPQLKEYMEYQRKLNHERLVYHALDEAKNLLHEIMDDKDQEKQKSRLEKVFPFSHEFANADTLLLMLRKLINAHNSTNNWYRMNQYYFALVYDCIERFLKEYNQLVKEQPEKAKEYNVSEGVEVDFDDWIQLYFQGLDFCLGKKINYVHFVFMRRNATIAEAISVEMKGGKTKEAALEAIKDDFGIDPSATKIILGKSLDHKDLELFYTSVENPIYASLHDANTGFMDEETLLDHSYFLAHQLKGLSEGEAASMFEEMEKVSEQ